MKDELKPPRAVLARAMKGDRRAVEEVTMYAFRTYRYRLLSLKAQDLVMSLSDMETTFYEGILRHVVGRLDYRGCPYYHLGQRGMWYVLSEIRASSRYVTDRASVEQLEQLLAYEEDWDGVDAAEDARRQLDRMSTADMTPAVRRLFEAARSGEAGDPLEDGYNRRLAEALAISPQRASVLMAKLRDSVSDYQQN